MADLTPSDAMVDVVTADPIPGWADDDALARLADSVAELSARIDVLESDIRPLIERAKELLADIASKGPMALLPGMFGNR